MGGISGSDHEACPRHPPFSPAISQHSDVSREPKNPLKQNETTARAASICYNQNQEQRCIRLHFRREPWVAGRAHSKDGAHAVTANNGDVKDRPQYTLSVSLNYVRHYSNTDSKLTGSVSKSELAADTRSKYAAWPCVP